MQTDFLFAQPNFLSGIATAFDIGGTMVVYNGSDSDQEADLRALASDWAMVGEDIENSAEAFEKEQNLTEKTQ